MEKVRTSRLIGKTVSDTSGKVLGTVEDVELSGGSVYLVVRTASQGSQGSQGSPARTSQFWVSWDQVASVQDIILLKIKHEMAALQAKICAACGYQNRTVAQFCRKCGRALV
jgi:sporulation protein YlmC with PRC-barrel domain